MGTTPFPRWQKKLEGAKTKDFIVVKYILAKAVKILLVKSGVELEGRVL